ncbi:DUF4282 domain-containing protein [Trebonia sp.]|uniref:DUF4282 domain-containing protein n=1 Tax=Trebonia sp. TaxID=2767075 RepID=UPI002639630D|nr:DUF4282 domain-containing protein [Trebonia sp.]
MAGQPQDPPWQAFPAPSADKQDTYGYPPPGGQSYAQPAPGYPGPSYAAQDQAYDQDQAYQDQAYENQAYHDQGYPGSQGQAAPQWQAAAGRPGAAATARASGQKGFFGSLFDFSFTSFVTPKIIKVLYVLVTIWTVLWALIFLRIGFHYGGMAGGILTLVVIDPIFVLLTLGAYRVVLEFFAVIFRIYEEVRVIRGRGDDRG